MTPPVKLEFFDSATPSSILSGSHALVYINGRFRWSRFDIERMAAVFRTSVLPEASWAMFASEIDIESGAATVFDAVPFVQFRRNHFIPANGISDAKCYVNRGNWGLVAEQFDLHHEEHPLWHVATLDGTRYVEETVNGKVLTPWAVQAFAGADTGSDTSLLYGIYDFHRP